MRLALIINPVSGRAGSRRAAASEREALARRVLQQIGVAADVVITRARGHGAELARDFVRQSYDRVIAWGGDGTVNEVAGPLIGTTTALGIVASGSGDGLAHGVGVSARPDDALASACRAPIGRIDVGWFGDRHFLNVSGVGFDAAVAERFNELRTRGPRGYVTGILSMIWGYQAPEYRLQLGTAQFDGPQFLIAFSNGREYGNRLVLSAAADISDGWLDAVVVDPGSPWKQLWRARRLAVGAHRPAQGIHRVRVQHALISGDELVCHVDGETFRAHGTIEVKIQPKAIGVVGAWHARPGQ
jgi:diacylglycerol kinase family enzyme